MTMYADKGLITSIYNQLEAEINKIYEIRGGVFTKLHPEHEIIRKQMDLLATLIANNLTNHFTSDPRYIDSSQNS